MRFLPRARQAAARAAEIPPPTPEEAGAAEFMDTLDRYLRDEITAEEYFAATEAYAKMVVAREIAEGRLELR